MHRSEPQELTGTFLLSRKGRVGPVPSNGCVLLPTALGHERCKEGEQEALPSPISLLYLYKGSGTRCSELFSWLPLLAQTAPWLFLHSAPQTASVCAAHTPRTLSPTRLLEALNWNRAMGEAIPWGETSSHNTVQRATLHLPTDRWTPEHGDSDQPSGND